MKEQLSLEAPKVIEKMTEPSPVKSEENSTPPFSEAIYATARDDTIKPVVLERTEQEVPKAEVEASLVEEVLKAKV